MHDYDDYSFLSGGDFEDGAYESIDPELEEEKEEKQSHLENLYQSWFLDYASYVILERAIPYFEDGLKPVQRRILHSMNEIDDGRFHKVANIIGHTMQYHPHGDAAINDALVNIGQKDLLVDTQGNWGDICTGDRAAAARYIEARLTPFAKEVMFNAKVTKWQMSYDGRREEPITLPVKFPLLLAQGVEGIAVGLATKIMPHNFNELLDASCDILRKKPIYIVPDFPTGGKADFSNYNGGQKGGKIRVRADIEIADRKTLSITSVPYGTTTNALIDSIIKANDNGKIKIKKIVDNTAKFVSISVEIPSGISPQMMIDALYAFTNCEVSISPNCCVVIKDKPCFIAVEDLLRKSTANTVEVLQKELKVTLKELQAKWHFISLEKIFIENRIYRKIEECEDWKEVISCIKSELEVYEKHLKKPVTNDDITKLTEIKIRRISRYNNRKAEEQIQTLEMEIEKVEDNLANISAYAIRYFQLLKKKYSKERKTKIESFSNIEAAKVAVANQKLYVNRKDGFVGSSLKKDEFVCECSDIDDVIVFLRSGACKVVRISDKCFVGKDIIYVDVWKKSDDRKVYNLIYRDGTDGRAYGKRFNVNAITRDKEYDLTKGTKGSKILYFTANANGETEIITMHLHPKSNARTKAIDFDFADLAVKGRSAQGNIVSKYLVSRVTQKEQGISSFGPMRVWFDEDSGKLNKDELGIYLGSFAADEYLLVIYKDGICEINSCDLEHQYQPNSIKVIEKFQPQNPITIIHHDGKKKKDYVKRFELDDSYIGKPLPIISEHSDSKILHVFTQDQPCIKIYYMKKRPERQVEEAIDLKEFIGVKGWKALGNRLSTYDIMNIQEATTEEMEEFKQQQAEENADKKDEDEKDDPNKQMAMF